MLTSLENGLGLDIVIWLQNHGNLVLDALTEVLNVVGGSMFMLILGPLIYWSLHKRTGQQMVLLLLFGALTYTAAKQIIDSPRPYAAHPDQVTPLFEVDGGGMPSGHVVNTILLWFPVATLLTQRDRRWWWAYGGFILLMAWGRMYAGVHYPQDVIGGMLLGGLIIWLYTRFRLGPEILITPGWLTGLTLFALILIPLFWSYDDGLTGVGAFLGALWGLHSETRYVQFTVQGDRFRRALRYGVGIAITLAIFFGLRILFGSADPAPILRVLRYGLTLLFIAAGWPWLWSRIGL